MKIFANMHIVMLLNLILQSQLNAMDPPKKQDFVLDYGADTALGSSHRRNEDRFLCRKLDDINGPATVFAVFDGHGGPNVAHYLEEYFCATLQEVAGPKTILDLEVVKEAFRKADILVKWMDKEGSTAIVVIIQSNRALIAHVGHCRAVFYVHEKNGGKRFTRETPDHRVDNRFEFKRIKKAGGKVLCQDNQFRVDGNMRLLISRTIGDYWTDGTKDKGIICEPDIFLVELDENYKFLILGSHGLWDAITSEVAAVGIRSILPDMTAKDAASRLIEIARQISPKGHENDMTAIVVKLSDIN